MFDTIAVKFPEKVDTQYSNGWRTDLKGVSEGKFIPISYLNVTMQNGEVIKCKYLPHSYTVMPLFRIEFSLPKLLYGTNIIMLNNLEEAITKANEVLAGIPVLPSINLWNGVLDRLDICYNHQVGDAVPYFVKSLQQLEKPHRKTLPYTSEGVEYFSKLVITKFYNKEKESGDPKAHGILRQEIELHSKNIKKLTGNKKPTLQDITKDWLYDALENELQQLGLLGCSIGTYETTLKLLCEEYGRNEGIYYFGLLKAKTSYPSKETLATDIKLHSSTLGSKLRKIVKAGVPLALAETYEPLPPLVIER